MPYFYCRYMYNEGPDSSDGHFNYDIITILQASKRAKQAAKVMIKQQKKISREKAKSKERYMDKYNYNLTDLQSAVKEMYKVNIIVCSNN